MSESEPKEKYQTLTEDLTPLEWRLMARIQSLLDQVPIDQQEAVTEQITEITRAATIQGQYQVLEYLQQVLVGHTVEVVPPSPRLASPAEVTENLATRVPQAYDAVIADVLRIIRNRPEDPYYQAQFEKLKYLEHQSLSAGVDPMNNDAFRATLEHVQQEIAGRAMLLEETSEVSALTDEEVAEEPAREENQLKGEPLVFHVKRPELSVYLHLLETYAVEEGFYAQVLEEGLFFYPTHQEGFRPRKDEILWLGHEDQLQYTYLGTNDKKYTKTFIFSASSGRWIEKKKSFSE